MVVAGGRWSGGGETATRVACLLDGGPVAGLSDAQLLDRFATRRSREPHAAESAFAALVARHGPMVHRTCRALLRDGRDAEEAYQATFVVLARRAGPIARSGGPLGPWLYGVARRVALKARVRAARRNGREGGLGSDPSARPERGPCPDLLATLHAEIGRLPEKYRRPVVLCHLEGLTHAEAAAELGWPVGTVSVRLARARDQLRGRLARRGFAPADCAAAFGPALWAGPGVVPPVAHLVELAAPAWTVSATVAPVAPLTRTTMMTLSGWKWLLVPLALIAGAAGGAVAVQWKPPAARPTPPTPQPQPRPLDKMAPTPVPDRNLRTPFDVSEPEPEPSSPPTPPPIPPDFFRLFNVKPDDPGSVRVGQTITVEVLEALPGRPLTGERVVRPDGTITLGWYGDLQVVGLNRIQIKIRLIEHLRAFLKDESLGLLRQDVQTGKVVLVPPAQSNRVYVDDAPERPVPRNGNAAMVERLDALLKRFDDLEREVRTQQGGRLDPRPTPTTAQAPAGPPK